MPRPSKTTLYGDQKKYAAKVKQFVDHLVNKSSPNRTERR